MALWQTVRIRSDLLRILQAQAAEQSRSVAGQLDFILTRALEQEPGTDESSARQEGLAGRRAPVPARAPVAQRIEGQTTIEEMLASCPNCAGEMQDFCLDDDKDTMAKRCEDCGFVREPS